MAEAQSPFLPRQEKTAAIGGIEKNVLAGIAPQNGMIAGDGEMAPGVCLAWGNASPAC